MMNAAGYSPLHSAGYAVFDVSREHCDPTTVSKYPKDKKIIDNKGNFSLVQMGLMDDG